RRRRLLVAQQQLVQQRGERCTLAAGGDVGGAQVVQDGQARSGGEAGGVADLEGRADAAVLAHVVVEGLAVGRDQVGAAVGGEDPCGGRGEGIADRGVQAVPGRDAGGGR